MRDRVTAVLATLAWAWAKNASDSASGISAESTVRDRGPCTASIPKPSVTSSSSTRSPAPRSDEPAEDRPAGGEQELVGGVPEHHPVPHHVPAVVAPGRVLRLAGLALRDVADQRAGQQPFGVRSGDDVLVERRGVEDPDRVPDREVLVLRRVGVAQRRERALPVGVETLVVELAQPLVEGGRAHVNHGTRY